MRLLQAPFELSAGDKKYTLCTYGVGKGKKLKPAQYLAVSISPIPPLAIYDPMISAYLY